jgi:hypothetical protein
VDADDVPADLPVDAHDVNYIERPRGSFSCEFSCGEQAFRAWIAGGVGSIESRAARPQLVEITAPVAVRDMGRTNGPSIGNVIVTKGLIYQWSKEDRGLFAVFDRSTGRAYYDFHSH